MCERTNELPALGNYWKRYVSHEFKRALVKLKARETWFLLLHFFISVVFAAASTSKAEERGRDRVIPKLWGEGEASSLC